jgi:heptose I phosphotransferase
MSETRHNSVRECYLREDIATLWPREQVLSRARALDGEVFRQVANRRTIKVVLAGNSYFAKLHEGVGWREMVKNWLILKKPVVSARNEFEACVHLERCGIVAPRVAAFAETTDTPARRFSFVLCDALEDYENLESLTLRWHDNPPTALEKRRLVMRVAAFARRFHEAGVVHRDFYLCHLLTSVKNPQAPLGVLDLHRALLFDVLPRRWRLRDLAALLFSSLDLPLSRRAWLRFVRVYTNRPLRETFSAEGDFWRAVYRRALALQAKQQRKNPHAGVTAL